MSKIDTSRARNKVGFHKVLLPSNFRSALRKDYWRRHRAAGPDAPHPACVRQWNRPMKRK